MVEFADKHGNRVYIDLSSIYAIVDKRNKNNWVVYAIQCSWYVSETVATKLIDLKATSVVGGLEKIFGDGPVVITED